MLKIDKENIFNVIWEKRLLALNETYLHKGILRGYKKEGNLTFWEIMDGPAYYYAKGWNLMDKINKLTKQEQTHRYGEQMDSCQKGGVSGRADWKRWRD